MCRAKRVVQQVDPIWAAVRDRKMRDESRWSIDLPTGRGPLDYQGQDTDPCSKTASAGRRNSNWRRNTACGQSSPDGSRHSKREAAMARSALVQEPIAEKRA